MATLRIVRWGLVVLLASTFAFPEVARTAETTASPETIARTTDRPADIDAFVREGCPHCARAETFLATLKREQPALRIVVSDVRKEPAALERLMRIARDQGASVVKVPAFFIGGQLIVGYSDEATTGQLIRAGLVRVRSQRPAANNASAGCRVEDIAPCEANAPETFTVNFFGHSVSLDQVGLPLFTLTMGLLDGFNPCSMWVLILMISLLAPMNSRPRMFAIAGTFVAVQGIAYFVFMAAWLNLFLLIGLSRPSEIVIAALALLAGTINLKDFLGLPWAVSLSIPASARPGIYARMRHILQADNLTAAMISAVTLAVLVQIVELMCTSGFPALFTRILTLRQLDSLGYYGYLLLYDLAYMLDDVIVLAIGVVTLSQRRLHEKEGRWLKLVSGMVMIGLGVYLLLVPH
jgi:glutaredoxin